jgi:glycopeptide antibiotics resistance protein
MPTGRRQKIENKPASLVSDEIALVIYAALLAAWIGCLLWSSLASDLPTIPRILAWDKLQHFFAYAVLMFFSGHFFKLLIKKRQKGWIIGFLFTVGFGLLMEIGQKTLTSSRQADWKDLVANTLGAGLVLAIALLTKEKRS